MFKTEIEFSRNTLYINIEGNVNRDNLVRLKQKIYYIIDEYNVFDIVINVKNSEYVDTDAFYNFLDEYDIKYGGNLIVVE
ncbi:MAG: hypothetical protein PHW32_03865 [Bacilli bacterium]|nr:hypothetical protein [Bacilli bacterium]MDD4282614.1 hypothetical protein [Bacilli bacterium]MDD4718516.1 hypothetical protein [Bacilli bacterium]